MTEYIYEFGIETVTANSPVTFKAIRSSNLCQIGNTVENNYTYKDLENDVTTYYRNWSQGFPPQYLNLKKGDLVAANYSLKWYRGQIKELYERSNSREALVFLIDRADEIRISIDKLRVLNENFSKYDKRTVNLKLENLVPNSLKYNLTHDLKVEFHQSYNWDDHALVYVRKIIAEHCNFEFKTSAVLPNGSHLGKLFMTKIGDRYPCCLNDMLTLEKYAVIDQPSFAYERKEADLDFKEICKIRAKNDETSENTSLFALKNEFGAISTNSYSVSDRVDESFRRRQLFGRGVSAITSKVEGPIGRARLMQKKLCSPSKDFGDDEPVVGKLRICSELKLQECSLKDKTEIPSQIKIQELGGLRPENISMPSVVSRGRGYLQIDNRLRCEPTNYNDVKLSNSNLPQHNLKSNVDLKKRHNGQIDQNVNFVSSPLNEKSLPVKSNCDEKNERSAVVLPLEQVSNLEVPPSTMNLSVQKRVLTFGSEPPKWISEFKEISMDSSFVNNLMEKLKISRPKSCQRYMIPSILKLRDVALIGDPRTGKTISYLVPLICCLLGRLGNLLYDSLKDVDGCLILILCSNWRSVEAIYSTLTQILSFDRRSNSLISIRKLHGGLSAKKISVELAGKYSILISTPISFLRENVQTGEYKRLCHLILDDGDVLLDLFSDEVIRITQSYNRVAKMHQSSCVPHQIILISCKWTKKIQAYIHYQMKEVLLYFPSFFESWVYSGAKTSVHLMETGEKQQFLIDFMQPVISCKDRKIVICSSRDEQLVQIYGVVRRLCPSTILCTSKMNVHEINDVRLSWAGEPKFSVLVAADNCLKELEIFDADWVISYNIPSKAQEYLAVRFMCLLNHAQRVNVIQKPDLKISSKCEVHLMITSKCNYQSHGLINLLQRLDIKVPAKLKALCYGYYEGREVAKMNHVPLCYNIKSFGRCFNSHYCGDRHLLLETEDAPRLDFPLGSFVVLKVTYVKNVNQFYGRVRKRKDTNGTWVNVEETFEKLEDDLAYHFSKPSSQIPVKPDLIQIGDVGAVKFKDSWHRVKVLNKPNGKYAYIPELKVLFIDEGRQEYVANNIFYRMPKDLQEHLNLVEVILTQIQPNDREREWFEGQVIEMNKMIAGQDVIGIVSLSMGNTLWLHTVNVIVESEMQRLCPKYNVINELRKRKIIPEHDNQNHMVWLTELVSSVFAIKPIANAGEPDKQLDQEVEDLDSTLKDSSRDFVKYKEASVGEEVETIKSPLEIQSPNFINESSIKATPSTCTSLSKEIIQPQKVTLSVNQPEKVFVSSLEDPHLFYVQKVANLKILKKLETSLHRHFNELTKPCLTQVTNKEVPYAVLVNRASEQIGCFRALLCQLSDDEKLCRVILVDYGNMEEIESANVRLLPNKYLQLQFQAVECKLHDVQPFNEKEGWTSKVGDRMWQLSLDNKDFKKIMSVTLVKEIDGVSLVKLYDDSKDFQLEIAQILHEENLVIYKACLKEESKSDFYFIPTPNSLKPSIEWSATVDSIRLKFKVAGIGKYKLEINENQLFFQTFVKNCCYEVMLDLCAPLKPKTLNVKLDPYCLVITCDKMRSERWTHLLKDKFKPFWLKPDLNDKYIDASSDDESVHFNWSDDGRLRKEKSNVVDGALAGGLEDMTTEAPSSSSSDCEESEEDHYFS